MNIKEIKGIGDKTAKLLNELDIYEAEDLLTYFPRNYDIYEEPALVKDIIEPGIYAIYGEVCSDVSVFKRGNKQLVSTLIKDYNGDGIKVTWFNMPFLKTTLKRGNRFVFRGRLVFKMGSIIMEHPVIYSPHDYNEKLHTMQPIYSLTKGLTNNLMIKSVKQALLLCNNSEEYMPFEIRHDNKLMDYYEAINKIHFPSNFDEYRNARKRIVFDEFFFFILSLKKLKEDNISVKNEFAITESIKTKELINNLPYTLTNAQINAYNDICNDLSSSKITNRLIQGDVGSGKTIVAILALMNTVFSGYQGAMMVPTEVLAKQQYESTILLFNKHNIDIKVALLVGSMSAKAKKEVYSGLCDGSIDIVIGTSAIIQDKVEFANLALVITDEQHRFGVNQRSLLSQKGLYPNVIVMSATPIPRTLAIILYGDLDISVIDELPANRRAIKNCVVDDSYHEKAYSFIRKNVNEGRQAYVICPMVEESDSDNSDDDIKNVNDYAKELEKILPDIKIAALHGKMKASEKNEIMESFAKGIIDVLVSTTVIEVGVNVPNANVIMIENADRFGLAQLHQLRGRVGRGEHQSYCIFVSNNKNKETKKRLDIMNKSNDGFYIANEDLKSRGPGDLFGIRQSGDFEFGLADIYNDSNELKMASTVVDNFLNKKYNISDKEEKILSIKLEKYMEKCLKRLNL